MLVLDHVTYQGFFYDGACLFSTDGYYLLRSNQKSDSASYRFVSVSFGGEKLYDYLCDDGSIRVGDRVTVDASGEEKEVVVCKIFEKKEAELPLPFKAYKRVKSKM